MAWAALPWAGGTEDGACTKQRCVPPSSGAVAGYHWVQAPAACGEDSAQS